MDNTTIGSLLSGLQGLVGDARGSLFGQDKCMVDREQLLNLVDALQTQIPQEIEQSKAIIESCDALRQSAKRDAAETRKNADQVLVEAEERAAKLIEEDTIVTFAHKREEEILAQAEQQRQELISGAISYADHILEEAQQTVTDIYDTLDTGLSALQTKAKEDRALALSQLKEARSALKKAAKAEQEKK